MFLTLKERKMRTYPVNLLPNIPRPPIANYLGEPSRPCVLLALDHTVISRMLAQYLKWQGLSVVIAVSAEQTLKFALSNSVDLVVYSAALSKSPNPLALLTGIRERGGKMPFIAIVEKDFNAHQEYLQQGVNAIIKKPLEIAELQTKIEQQLNKS